MSVSIESALGGRSRGDRQAQLQALHHSADDVLRKAREIYEATLTQSSEIRSGNFTAMGVVDLRLLFGLYDAAFFSGLLGSMLREDGPSALEFRLSTRMTRAAGKTFLRRRRIRLAGQTIMRDEYEIAISTLLLFQTFRDGGRTAAVGGLVCHDRLEALQRIVEHELLHLAEFLAWGRSSCAAENFQTLSWRIFSHSAASHDLVTPREVAATVYAIRVGDRVHFTIEGVRLRGRVNRITKRATVLVEDPGGEPYSDGRRYATYYVPLAMLTKEEAGPPRA